MAENTKQPTHKDSEIVENDNLGHAHVLERFSEETGGDEQFSIIAMDTDDDGIMPALDDGDLSWMRNTVDSGVLKKDMQSVETLRVADLFGNDAEGQAGQAALDDLLANPANHEWMSYDGVFTAADDKGTEITLNLSNAPALLMMSYKHDGKVCDHYVALQKTSVLEHLEGNTDGQAIAHMIQEIIKAGGTG